MGEGGRLLKMKLPNPGHSSVIGLRGFKIVLKYNKAVCRNSEFLLSMWKKTSIKHQ